VLPQAKTTQKRFGIISQDNIWRQIFDQLGLAAARDAHVKVNALADLTAHFKTELSTHSFDEIKRILSADCRQQQAALSRGRASKEVVRLLKSLANRLGSVKLEASGWAAIGPGSSAATGTVTEAIGWLRKLEPRSIFMSGASG